MENKTSAIQEFKQSVVTTYRDFFDLEALRPTMPSSQTTFFIAQALKRHYRIALFLDDAQPVVGNFTRQLDSDRFLFKHYRTNVYQLVSLDHVQYLQRV